MIDSGAPAHPRRLLLVTATLGYESDDFRAAARKLGIECTLATDRCHMLEDPWSDGALPLRFEDPPGAAAAIVEFARGAPVHGIVPVGDRTVVIAALAAAALGLPHNPPEAAAACRNKFEARRRLAAAGVRVPEFARFSIDADPREVASAVAFPCVVKPLCLSASRGVIRANDTAELVVAFQRVAALLRQPQIRQNQDPAADWILIEGYLPGCELALEGLLVDGRLEPLALFDKPDPLEGPYFEETLYVTPSRLGRSEEDEIHRCAESACVAIGLRHGPIHAELRWNNSGPWILEIAARSIGGLCARTLRFGTGMSLEEIIIRHALGMEVEPVRREEPASGVMMIPIPAGGILRAVHGIEDARAIRGVEDVAITAKLDHKIQPLPEGASYLGFLFARGPTPDFVEATLRAAHARLRVEIVPDLPVTR